MGFHQFPSTILFDDHPIPKRHPQIGRGCRIDYIEVFGAVYWEKNPVKQNRGSQKPPSDDEG